VRGRGETKGERQRGRHRKREGGKDTDVKRQRYRGIWEEITGKRHRPKMGEEEEKQRGEITRKDRWKDTKERLRRDRRIYIGGDTELKRQRRETNTER
jgi:hypothetical protein